MASSLQASRRISQNNQRVNGWTSYRKVIWSHNTAESRATKFSPFKLLYGEEAMTLEEIKFGS
jgi:hypothetical protein